MTDSSTGAPLPEAGHTPSHPLERLIFFSDAVFAIAITLLIIEVHAPHFGIDAPIAKQLNAFFGLIPSLFGFFISFAVIGAFWAGHHRAFSLARHYSPKLMTANLAMLCAIVFIPFATAFMSSNLGAVVPATIYNLTLLVTGLLNMRLVRLATAPPVVSETADPATIANTRARSLGVVLGAICALALGFLDARFSQMALATIPLWQRLLRRRVEAGLGRGAEVPPPAESSAEAA